MNRKLILNLVGKVLQLESALMLVPLLVSLIERSGDAKAFLLAIALTLAVGSLLTLFKPREENLRAREGFIIVAFSWICVSLFGALPFFISRAIPSYIDCVFEVVSGFTTTGASILTDVEALPRGLMFWRSFTHWAGGMGVLVLSLALIPRMGARSIHLMRAESPGPSTDKLVPRISKNAKILYQLYIGLSLVMFIILLLCGMDLYDALINTFGTAGTGGFSNWAASIAHYNSPLIETVIAVFMMLFGINFSLYFLMLRKNWKDVARNSELRVYLCLVFGSTLAIALNILPMYGMNFLQALRYSYFQVTSVISTSGFSTCDFDLWPSLSKAILVLLMLSGACAGSTCGGMKVIRLQLLFKGMIRDIRTTVHPKAVNIVKLDGHRVDESVMSGVQGFFYAYFFVLIGAVLMISIDGFSFETNVTAVIATLSNIGPGLAGVGPAASFAIYSPFSKIVLTLCMLIGRLELFPMLMLVFPRAWRD